MRDNPFKQLRFIDRAVRKTPAERFKCIPYAVKTAALRDQLAMQRDYFISTDAFYADHFASALNAAR